MTKEEEYLEYLEECKEREILRPRTFREYCNWGNIVNTGYIRRHDVVEVIKEKKVDIARRIYQEMLGSDRLVVISRFMSEAGLSKAGAATYYSNFVKGIFK